MFYESVKDLLNMKVCHLCMFCLPASCVRHGMPCLLALSDEVSSHRQAMGAEECSGPADETGCRV